MFSRLVKQSNQVTQTCGQSTLHIMLDSSQCCTQLQKNFGQFNRVDIYEGSRAKLFLLILLFSGFLLPSPD